MSKTATCDTCRAEIIWAPTVNGKPMPLDVKPQHRFILKDDGTAVAVKTYLSHFASCPQADQHRKRA